MSDNPWIDIPVVAVLVILAIFLYVMIYRAVNKAEDERQRREARWYGGMSALSAHAQRSDGPTPGFNEIADAVNRNRE